MILIGVFCTLTDMCKEIWKPIRGHEGLYAVSNLGRVKSLSTWMTTKGGGLRKSSSRILKPLSDFDGYYFVTLCKEGRQKHCRIHRLVAEAFLDNPEEWPQVNHVDGNKSNNRVENLEWCTAKENISHSIQTNLRRPSKGVEVECVETGQVFLSISAAERWVGHSISHCLDNPNRVSGGLHFVRLSTLKSTKEGLA